MHPRTLKTLEAHWPDWRPFLEDQNINATPPMGYVDLLRAAHNAPLVLTDSGGVQKEAFSLGTPCAVLRDTTEWVEQVERGQSALVETPADLAEVASAMLRRGRSTPDDLYGDGKLHVPFWSAWKPFPHRHEWGLEIKVCWCCDVVCFEQATSCDGGLANAVWPDH